MTIAAENTPTRSLSALAVRGAPWIYGGAMLLSAALVFSVQPMFTKMVLPRVGGGAGVWAVALVFFQGALLAGYAYAHAVTRFLGFKAQVATHLGVLAVSALWLPLAVAAGFDAPPQDGQAIWLLALFGASVGVPFAACSATSPLLQAWYARTGRADAADPYYLYSASNVGSLVALLSFPLVIEPAWSATVQANAWSWGFAGLAASIAGCAALVIATRAPALAAPTHQTHATPWNRRLTWLALGFVPSLLLVAASTHINTDVASAPLLWVIPLALYLLAFILAFSSFELPSRVVYAAQTATVVLALVMAAGLLNNHGWQWLCAVTLSALFIGAYVGCRALYNARPDASDLTEFYLWMSVGGVIGGAAAAIVAPLVFDTPLEWPLALIASLLVRPRGEAPARPLLIATAVALALGAIGVVGALIAPAMAKMFLLLAVVSAACAAALGNRYRVMLVAGCLILVLVGSIVYKAGAVFVDRSFYGVVRVFDSPDGKWRQVAHGTTAHGFQSLDPKLARTPAGYYAEGGGIGHAFQALNEVGRLKNVAVLGLGAGGVACHAQPGQNWTFYEIDPLFVRVAQDKSLFTFLSNCTPDARIIVGDARLEVAKAPLAAFDLILADAFSSDSVPPHLLTKEAIALYLSRLTPDGVVLLHVSNRNLSLIEVAERAAIAGGGVAIHFKHRPNGGGLGDMATNVVAVARNEAALAPLMERAAWEKAAPRAGRPWTDDYSNVLDPFLLRMRGE